MKTSVWMAAAALVSLSAIGCTPSPEKVCDHMTEVVENDPKLKELMSKQPEEKKKKGREDCVSGLTKEKEKDADGYKCASKCVMAAKDLDAIGKCAEECPSLKKAKGGGGGDDDKKKKDD